VSIICIFCNIKRYHSVFFPYYMECRLCCHSKFYKCHAQAVKRDVKQEWICNYKIQWTNMRSLNFLIVWNTEGRECKTNHRAVTFYQRHFSGMHTTMILDCHLSYRIIYLIALSKAITNNAAYIYT
jgi:hypothetical protein